ncbi:hypothetical protein AAA799E16_01925 [Marine Group I thaumarchaeote SCGC AAA799-E16]|uniref:Carboxypeptidase regulatory-like domain-containing protein n=4 Tax=Marine Group I TaxID=905826 RepID=A0A081RNY6_9ARCH|nr:hypothetical protein AAA799N04_00579 [Marine Group I thaumarchaeote SCGC AAA799-N04]KER05434.1 hypothetical protein AAA799E16_01925 [Marine Group I thaumarchaeote SCGC AAA799-E16]KFM15668.1 hypothetical protein AAA799D11_01110 [Marine Group I thaumarchaeote SCGC AAA799-D11]KFM16807.1 hypothetical protein SCCGRSA3_02056 [Marine Group I thaumarchaeote SCGC RSA3]
MYKIASAILLSSLMTVLLLNPAWAAEDFMLTVSSLSEYKEGEHSVISGKTMTLDERPVSDVQIYVYFSSGIIKTTTNSTGQFSAASPETLEMGEYDTTVSAKKDNKYANAEITYKVIENKAKNIKVFEPKTKTPKTTDGKVKLDPFSKMIQELEKQKTQEVKRETDIKEQQEIDDKRRLAQLDLQNDLKESEKRNEVNSPRNVFYKFIQEIDSSVRGIFWQQFLFTEKITQQAQEAKEKALLDGKSSLEAMKIFQDEAAVTQKEVMGVNKNLSIKYGNATSSVQNMFDENGKLPRED